MIKPKVITLAMQLAKILREYKNVINYKIDKGVLNVIIRINSSMASNSYKVKIEYKLGKKPITNILDFDGKKFKAPHTYSNNELCLYYPKNKEWTKYDYIADRIIPWISEWIYFYEVWCVTGTWYGGGIHPER